MLTLLGTGANRQVSERFLKKPDEADMEAK